LRHEDPRFLLEFSKALTPAGSLRVDESTRAVVVRDLPEHARLISEIARQVDRPTPR
jgi:hypothetical protein